MNLGDPVVAATADTWGNAIAVVSAVAVAISAGVTAWMAHWTRKTAQAGLLEAQAVVEQGLAVQAQATATAEQARLTRTSLEATVRPWLILGETEDGETMMGRSWPVFPFTLRVEDDVLIVRATVRNVGNGLALIDATQCHLVGWSDPRSGEAVPMRFNLGRTSNPVLPPGEQARMKFAVPLKSWLTDLQTITHQGSNNGEFFLDVVYGDALGMAASRLRLHVARTVLKDRDSWDVWKASYFTPPDSEEPSVSVLHDIHP